MKELLFKNGPTKLLLTSTGVLKSPRQFNAVLAGTIPINLDVKNSDLDIICEAKDLTSFESTVSSLFGKYDRYSSYRAPIRGIESFVAKFQAEGFGFEIFAQNCPIEKQYAVIHMLVEKRLLVIGGEDAREKIRSLKREGIKTEPAFAQYFRITGDPYDELTKLAHFSDEELEKFFKNIRSIKDLCFLRT